MHYYTKKTPQVHSSKPILTMYAQSHTINFLSCDPLHVNDPLFPVDLDYLSLSALADRRYTSVLMHSQ